MEKPALAVLAGLAVAMTGCASIHDRLAAAKVCCEGPHQFRYQDLPLKGDLKLSISDESPVFEFPSGRSYFEAVRLAQPHRPARMRVKTHPGGPNVGWWQFCPSLTFLTAQYETIQTRYVQPQYHYTGFWTNEIGYYVADYEIPAGASYAIFHSEAVRAGERLTRVVPAQPSGVFPLGAVVIGLFQLASSGALKETQHTPCFPTGTLTIIHEPW